jgi:hypothetical protein
MFNPNVMDHPFTARLDPEGASPACQAHRLLKPFIADHFKEYEEAMEARSNENPIGRIRGHQMLRIAKGSADMARQAMEKRYELMGTADTVDNTVISGNIAQFITQEIHRSLDVWLRMIHTQLVSVQPLTQEAGYIFYDSHVAHPNTVNQYDLTDLAQFDHTLGDHDEGGQVDSVGVGLESEIVQVKWKALNTNVTNRAQNRLMTQHGLSARDWGDGTSAHMLAWLQDRDVIAALVAFAETNPRGPIHWDPTNGGTYDTMTPSEQHAYDKSFIRKILTARVDTEMFADRFVQPNWYIAGTNAAQLLARTPEMIAEKQQDMFDQSIARGTLANSMTRDGRRIYHDPMIDPDIMVCGHTNPLNPFWAGFAAGTLGSASLATAWWMNPQNLVESKARAVAYFYKGIRPQQYRLVRLTDEAEPT